MLFSDGPGIDTTLEQKEKEPVAGTSSAAQPMDIDTPIRDDGFGGHLGQDIICMWEIFHLYQTNSSLILIIYIKIEYVTLSSGWPF